MTVLEVIGVTLGVIFIGIGMIFLPILLINLIDHIVKSIRKAKHPEYFELYDDACKRAKNVTIDFSNKYKLIKHRLDMYIEGLPQGECTDVHFRKATQKFENEYIELVAWYNKEYKEINILLKSADKYAKEHNIKWGEIY